MENTNHIERAKKAISALNTEMPATATMLVAQIFSELVDARNQKHKWQSIHAALAQMSNIHPNALRSAFYREKLRRAALPLPIKDKDVLVAQSAAQPYSQFVTTPKVKVK